MQLIITTEGFINVEQVCEFRLRYTDVTTTDEVNAIDLVMANGRSHMVQATDPGFGDLVDMIEEEGFVLSVPGGSRHV